LTYTLSLHDALPICLLLTRAPYLGTPDALFEAAPGQAPVVDQPDRAAALGALLTAWDAAAPGPKAVELNEETRSALEALGYLDPAAPGAAP
jgi:hypothetical protein